MKILSTALLSYAFRPFFLLNALFAIVAVLAWVMTFHGHGLVAMTPMVHAHEMLVGFAMAAVAGFSLTAVATWTGRPAVHGAPLGWLVLFWLVGRLAMLSSGFLGAVWVGLLDMLFPLLLCGLFAREVLAAGNRRNYKLVALLGLLAALNGLYHLGALGLIADAERLAVQLLIHAFLLLVAVVAGRIIPAFTGNWLRQQGVERLPANHAGITAVAIVLTVLVGLAASALPRHGLTGWLALAAALAHALRLGQWRGLATVANPLLLVLHLAYAWLPLGYALLGMSILWSAVPASSALHALTMGVIGFMILAVTTRVSLGHTGRPLQASFATTLAYALLMVAVLARVFGPMLNGGILIAVDLSAAAWMTAFGVFLWVYWPVLRHPRAP